MLMIDRVKREWRSLLRAFCALEEIQFSAPWRTRSKC
jgi:hypothetical protein